MKNEFGQKMKGFWSYLLYFHVSQSVTIPVVKVDRKKRSKINQCFVASVIKLFRSTRKNERKGKQLVIDLVINKSAIHLCICKYAHIVPLG